MTLEDCVNSTLVDFKKLIRLDLVYSTRPGLDGMQRQCETR